MENLLVGGWVEVLAPDGRIFYHSPGLNYSSWEKPDELKSQTEKAVDSTEWREYRIWDGRSYYHNVKTGISVWSPPPEVEGKYRSITEEGMDVVMSSVCTPTEQTASLFAKDTRAEFVFLLSRILLQEEETDRSLAEQAEEILRTHEAFQEPRFQDARARRLALLDFFFFAERRKTQRARDIERASARAMIAALRELVLAENGSQIDQSSSYDSIVAWGVDQPWWACISEIRRRELFEAFVGDVARCRARDEAQRDAVFMQRLKDAIVGASDVDYTWDFDSAVRARFETLEAWQNLAEAQRVAVWRSCIAQHIRNIKSAISAGEALSAPDRLVRKTKDAVKLVAIRLLADVDVRKPVDMGSLLALIRNELMGLSEVADIDDRVITEILNDGIRSIKTGHPPFPDLALVG